MSLAKMTDIELCDVEEDKLYKFLVTQDNYNDIIAGDIELASKLLNEHKVKNNFVAAFQIMKETSKGVSGKPQLSAPSTSGLRLDENEDNKTEEAAEDLIERIDENEDEDNSPGKMWSINSTKFFIGLCKTYDKDLETGVKKYLWTKIANDMSQTFQKKFTSQQVDTKFKVLKNTYKKVKKHNYQSGNNKKNWEYFEAMDEIMFSKPEICARATCSSISGLVKNVPNVIGTSGMENITMTGEGDDNASSSSQFVSAFTTKRKHLENQVNKRHKEKMQRQDRYLDLLERLTTAIERNEGN